MSEAPTDQDSMQERVDRPTEAVRYPVNRVVGIIDTPEQVTSTVEALLGGGFLDSEVEVDCGGQPCAARARPQSVR